MKSRTMQFAAPYATVAGQAFGREGASAVPVDRTTPLPVLPAVQKATFRSTIMDFAPPANSNDVAALLPLSYGRTGYLTSMRVSATAAASPGIPLSICRTKNGGGLPDFATTAPCRSVDNRPAIGFGAFNTVRGNIGGTRQRLGAGVLVPSSPGNPGRALTVGFGPGGQPSIAGLNEWLTLDWGGQPVPDQCRLTIEVEWEERTEVPVFFAGDSTTSNAKTLFQHLSQSQALAMQGNLLNAGSNGYRLIDYLKHTNGIPFAQGSNGVLDRMGGMPGVLVLCFGLNDIRQGQVARNELISMIDAAIHATLNGTVAGEEYRSGMGAKTAFAWPSTIAPNPDARIILWTPNSVASDQNQSGWIVLQNRFAGLSLEQAAQTMTDDLRLAYAAFAEDRRIFRLVDKQQVFGAISRPLEQMPLLKDSLHPNTRGETLSARQIFPHILDALASIRDELL